MSTITAYLAPSPFPCSILSTMNMMELSANQFLGLLPSTIGLSLPNLEELYLGDNRLTGVIPCSVTDASILTILNMGPNVLTGAVPNFGNLRLLKRLLIEENNLTGESSGLELRFFSLLTNCRYLELIEVSLNQLNGILPASIGNFSISLQVFRTFGCHIKAAIPDEIGNLSSLADLYSDSNQLTGFIPRTLGKLRCLQRIYLEYYKLDGFIPAELCQLSNLGDLYQSNNMLYGSIPTCLGELKSFRRLYLDSNQLESTVPLNLWNLKDLLEVNLSSNSLRGSLSSEIKNLKVVNQLDLSQNQFTGDIPSSAGSMQSLKAKIIQKLPKSEISLGVAWRRISYQELRKATNAFSETNILGSGSFCSVYEGTLYDGLTVAVKVFNFQSERVTKSFDIESEITIRYRNLVRIIGCCSNTEFKALILEYMPKGSLEKWLYSHNYFLDMLKRLDIAIDVALALEYLHHGLTFTVLDCDLKPTNVLLDQDMVGHIDDFGIAKLFGQGESIVQTKTLETIGYMAPGDVPYRDS
ncbi:Leucine-rich repeat protein kinase family protein [Forsythia ovata]|uniref:Leucine-rich repeat protein kinase family protein n=1 Tax=Forsythia ovata TaxID=205694 RepID=A0ABD1VN51_9LAMI